MSVARGVVGLVLAAVLHGAVAGPPIQAEDRRAAQQRAQHAVTCPERCRSGECRPGSWYSAVSKLGDNVCVHGCNEDGSCGVEALWYGTDCCACAGPNFDYEAGFDGRDVSKNACMTGATVVAPEALPPSEGASEGASVGGETSGAADRTFKCLEYSGVEGFAETNGASITVNGSTIPVSKAVISKPSVCMKWQETSWYVAYVECGALEVGGGCWEGMKYVNQQGTEECTCKTLSPDEMSCSEFSCTRDYIVQGGMQGSATEARPYSTCITLLASFVLFLHSY